MAYDRDTDVYEHALARLTPTTGSGSSRDTWAMLVPGAGLREVELERSDPSSAHVGGGWDDPYAWTRQQGVRLATMLQRKLGARWEDEDVGWVRCPRTSVWCIVAAQYRPRRHTLLRQPPVLCMIHMSRDMGRWTQFSWCDRHVEDGRDRCSMHGKVQDRRVAAREQRQREVEASDQRYARERQAEQDLRELWALACDHMDVQRPGHVSVPREHRADVDLEVLSMFLRTLVDRL